MIAYVTVGADDRVLDGALLELHVHADGSDEVRSTATENVLGGA